MSIRKEIISLTKKLKRLEKLCGMPTKPKVSPVSLYVEKVVKNSFFPPLGLGSRKQELLKEIYKQANADWKNMNPSEKEVFKEKANKIKEEYSVRKADWNAIIGQSIWMSEMEEIKKELKRLKQMNKDSKSVDL